MTTSEALDHTLGAYGRLELKHGELKRECFRYWTALDLIARQAGDPITRQRARVALGRSPNEERTTDG